VSLITPSSKSFLASSSNFFLPSFFSSSDTFFFSSGVSSFFTSVFTSFSSTLSLGLYSIFLLVDITLSSISIRFLAYLLIASGEYFISWVSISLILDNLTVPLFIFSGDITTLAILDLDIPVYKSDKKLLTSLTDAPSSEML